MRLNEVLNQMDKKTRISILSIFLLLISLVTLTVAYFALSITGNPTEDTISVVAADLRLKFTDTNIVNIDGVLPGYTTTKTFTVKNEGNVDLSYIPYFEKVGNSFEDQTDLVYTIECISDKQGGTCYNNLVETQLPNIRTEITRGITISPQETHTYTMTIIFKETNDNQNDNQGKRFKARIMIKEDEQPVLTNFSAVGNSNSVIVNTPYIPPEFTNIETYYYKYEPVAQNMSNTYGTNNNDLATPVAAGEYIETNDPYYTFEGLPPGDYIITSYVEDDRGRTSNEYSKQVKVIPVLQRAIIPEAEIEIYEHEDWDISWLYEPEKAPAVIKNANFENVEHIYDINTMTIPNNALGNWTDYDSEWGYTVLYWYTDEDNNGLYEIYRGHEPELDEYSIYSPLLNTAPTLFTSDSFEYEEDYGSNIESLVFTTTNVVPNGVLGSWDVSETQDGSIMAWYLDEDDNNYYEVTIGQTGGVHANPDSSYLFKNFINLYELDIEYLITSDVVYAKKMFFKIDSPEYIVLDLSSFDVSNVIDMSYIFEGNGDRNQSVFITGIDNWNTSNVQNMNGMFYRTLTGAIDISSWNVSNVTNMSYMFYGVSSYETNGDYFSKIFNLKLNNWDVSNVIDMSSMFENVDFYDNNDIISDWDVSNVINMSSMFDGADLYELDIHNWDVSNVTDMSYMFYTTGHVAIDLSMWDTVNVKYMYNLFDSCGYSDTIWNVGDLSNWDTSNVINMSSMFEDSGEDATSWNIGNIGNWDVSNVTNMSSMFLDAGAGAVTWNIGNIGNWDVSNVTDMSSMFYFAGESCSSWDIGDIGNWDVSNVTDMSFMFSDAGEKAVTWNIGNIENWDVSNVTDMSFMFSDVGEEATTWEIGDISKWQPKKLENFSYFSSKNILDMKQLLSNWNCPKLNSIGNLYNDEQVTIEDIRWIKSLTLESGYGLFSGADISLVMDEIETLDTSKMIYMDNMFDGATGSNGNWDLSGWDTSNVSSMQYMFNNFNFTGSELNINLSGWDTSNVYAFKSIFKDFADNTNKISLDLSGWTIGTRYNATSMFYSLGTSTANVIINISDMFFSSYNGPASSYYGTHYSWIFSDLSDTCQIIVGSTEVRDWILNLSSSNRPSAWTTANFTIAE